jgi:glycosyltransferase involved in cell wall biosynthesis
VLHTVADEELAVLQAVDQVWVSNEPERARVDAAARVAVVPNVVDVDSYPRVERRDPGALVYPARFDFWPNEEAARLLLDEVLPKVPDATLTLVGTSPPEWLRERANDRVRVTGPVTDIRPYLAAAAVMPVPLMAGAGTRLKVLEAFAVGVPVVSTAKGVEGLALRPGEHYVRAETAPEFVAALEQLRAEPDHADRMVTDARVWVQEHGSVAALHHAVARALADVTVG